ncbi:hypothetical protein R1sor_004889 [Riccia sorocarpa]|uniref:Uncharacterized protein n=1 Tax=Riccia sorocarpa TaxID=122646 RepID=A0ABD3HII9_9MARC
MARVKQTARKSVPKVVRVDRSELALIGPTPSPNSSGQVTLVRIAQSELTVSLARLVFLSFQQCISQPKADSDSDREEVNQEGCPSDLEMADPDNWPLPTDLQIENISDHWEPIVSWCVDYYDRARNQEQKDITLKLVVEDGKGKERMKELGTVFYANAFADLTMLEVMWENLRNKQLKKSIAAMTLLDRDLLAKKEKGGLRDT